jgi:ferritin
MNERVLSALNDQVRMEMMAFYTYLSMSAWLEANDWPGFAQWMRGHSDEEQMHAMKIFDYINERGGSVTLQALEQPPVEFDSVRQIFEEALAHERKVTAAINSIYSLAVEEGDRATQLLMDWYVSEQVEEEKVVEDALILVKRAGDDPFQLLYVEQLIASEAGADAGGGGEAPA